MGQAFQKLFCAGTVAVYPKAGGPQRNSWTPYTPYTSWAGAWREFCLSQHAVAMKTVEKGQPQGHFLFVSPVGAGASTLDPTHRRKLEVSWAGKDGDARGCGTRVGGYPSIVFGFIWCQCPTPPGQRCLPYTHPACLELPPGAHEPTGTRGCLCGPGVVERTWHPDLLNFISFSQITKHY